MKMLLALLIGAALGIWAYTQWQQSNRDADSLAQTETNGLKGSLNRELDLRTNEIKEELARTGKVVRKRAEEIGAVVADATADARITGAIKGRFALDPDLSALSISVNTTRGVVTLSGTVSSYENIGKAMQIALDTEGVREVVSTLQVSSKR